MSDKIDPSQPPTPKSRSSPQNETVVRLPLTELHPFKGYPTLRGLMPRNQPYLVRDDDPTMIQLVARIRERGVTYPGVVRPDPEGGYEIISGQRRHRASELAGIPDMPVIIRNMTDEEAATELVDSNIQREDVLPSERAWAYRLRLEVSKHQGARTDLTSPQIAAKLRSDDEIGKSLGISGDTLRRYASLTNLVPPLMKLVDEGEIGLSTAYPLAALTHDEQRMVLDGMDYSQNMPSLSQAQRIKKLSQQKALTVEQAREILLEEKKDAQDKVTFTSDTLHKYFPRSYTPKRMQETIIKLLEAWQKKRQRSQER
ncbi:hypothetical protein AGATL06_24160 [Agathobaculum sp. TL06]